MSRKAYRRHPAPKPRETHVPPADPPWVADALTRADALEARSGASALSAWAQSVLYPERAPRSSMAPTIALAAGDANAIRAWAQHILAPAEHVAAGRVLDPAEPESALSSPPRADEPSEWAQIGPPTPSDASTRIPARSPGEHAPGPARAQEGAADPWSVTPDLTRDIRQPSKTEAASMPVRLTGQEPSKETLDEALEPFREQPHTPIGDRALFPADVGFGWSLMNISNVGQGTDQPAVPIDEAPDYVADAAKKWLRERHLIAEEEL